MRAIAVCVLLGSVACAGSPWVVPDGAPPPVTVVITLNDRVHPGSWPTARAELGLQRVAFCPVRITTPEGPDDLSCDYLVGPLRVPAEFETVLRGDADEATVERTAIAIHVAAEWSDTSVSYRLDLRRDDTAPTDPAIASDTLRIVCDTRRTTVLTPVVRAKPDGLRFSIEASDEVAEFAFHRIAWEHGMSVGAPIGTGMSSVSIEPGAALVACLAGPRSAYWDVSFATFELIDPDELWITSGVDCDRTSTGEARLGTEYRWVPYPQLAEHLEEGISGFVAGDVLRPVGYPRGPGSKLYLWDGLVIRDGERVATVELDWDGRIRAEVCAGSGITVRAQ